MFWELPAIDLGAVRRAGEVVAKTAQLDVEIAALEVRELELANALAAGQNQLDAARKAHADAVQKSNELQTTAQIQTTLLNGHAIPIVKVAPTLLRAGDLLPRGI